MPTRPSTSRRVRCRFCEAPTCHSFVDLGMSPLCESFLTSDRLNQMEPFYPLHALVCSECFLVQLEAYVTAEHIFSDYAYFSSYSTSWVEHARRYAVEMINRFHLSLHHRVVELASNDGYLLQHFVAKGIPALGIEPAANVAEVAVSKGIPTLVRFFGKQTARELVEEGYRADLLVANNVLAQVPDLNDFIQGMKYLLNPKGVITVEFPSLLNLMAENQFDTIYHEHFSYFSFTTTSKIFAAHGLTIFDVEELSTHGGSLRVFARHASDPSKPISDRVNVLLDKENKAGVNRLECYAGFNEKVRNTKARLLSFLIKAKRENKSIVGYGAPGKGNTLLNYCGIRTDFLDYTVDRSPHKQGKFLPGTHIPILHPDRIRETRPDYILLLPWNLKDEIRHQLKYVQDWGGQLLAPIPDVQVVEFGE